MHLTTLKLSTPLSRTGNVSHIVSRGAEVVSRCLGRQPMALVPALLFDGREPPKAFETGGDEVVFPGSRQSTVLQAQPRQPGIRLPLLYCQSLTQLSFPPGNQSLDMYQFTNFLLQQQVPISDIRNSSGLRSWPIRRCCDTASGLAYQQTLAKQAVKYDSYLTY